jgi:hypothetical protein
MAQKKKKQRSGHAKREQKRLRAAAPLIAEWEERYRKVGPPPEDGARRVEWGNHIAALIAYEQIVAPAIRTPQERKLILEAVRTLGMTAVKALYEERLKKLEAKVYKGAGVKDSDAGDHLEESD